MKIKDYYSKGKTSFSFEFFPPKTPEAEANLFETISELKTLGPSFVSVTYGAMGSTRTNTLRIVRRIKDQIGMEVAAHLTCVGQSRDEIESVLFELKAGGIENLVALRGDPPKGEKEFRPVENGFAYAFQLVDFIRTHKEFHQVFSIAVAGYPEGHIECRDSVKSIEHLKIKVDAGADMIITQLFFNNDDYFRFAERARAAKIDVPIVAGIMPVTHGPQTQRFTAMCGASLPQELLTAIEKCGDNQEAVEAYGIDYATRQCRQLLRQGVPGLHFYTLNKSRATAEIYTNLGLAQN